MENVTRWIGRIGEEHLIRQREDRSQGEQPAPRLGVWATLRKPQPL